MPAPGGASKVVAKDMELVDGVKTAPYGLEYGGYDARRVNWPRLWERAIAAFISVILNGTLLVVAKALGIL